MNFNKLYILQNSEKKKDLKIKNEIVIDIVNNYESSHAIARIVHCRSHRHWTSEEEQVLISKFQNLVKSTGISYIFLSKSKRKNIYTTLAEELKRSPEAIKIRLKSLRLLPKNIRG